MTTSPTIEWPDFEKIDIRVGTILEVNEFPKAKRPAWQLTIDFGPLGIKKSSAQITELLVLGVYTDKKEVVLIQPDRQVENGWKLG